MILTRDELMEEMESRGALLTGHFRLSSGRHSDRFVQKFRILEDPALVTRVVAALLERLGPLDATVVVSAAVGGIVLGYECGRQLGMRAIFVEKENAIATFRRGFALARGERAVVVEDVITTGQSVREVIEVVRAQEGIIDAIGSIVERAPIAFGVRSATLLDLPIESFAPADCPLCRSKTPLTEPGSRFLR